VFDFLKVRASQGRQYVVDPRQASLQGFSGRPQIGRGPCVEGCAACVDACPTAAITLEPVRVDLGRCIFCGDCARECPPKVITTTNDYRVGAASREALVIGAGPSVPSAIAVSTALRARFGRSLKLRSVSSGGCSACELELNALGNVNFDLGRYGIEFVASPRHADALVLSGPLTVNMQEALELAWKALPAPRFVIAFGACAISGGLYESAPALSRGFLQREVPALYLPGCPPHPLTFVCAVLDLLGIGVG
jgi:Ni,Fe-hydrogenase III small subunit/ferredoxin